MQWYQAIQSGHWDFEDGRPGIPVSKGDMFPEGHEFVLRDADTRNGRVPWQNFKKLNLGEEEEPQVKAAAAKAPARGKAP
jgi:hypothetical protein